MMRAIVLFAILSAAQAAPVAVAQSAPLAAKKVHGDVTLSVEQQKTMHSGCVSGCKPSPVESKCVTACETAMYKCIDETGPNETPADTKKCQDVVLKKYEETKGVEKKEEKKEEKKDGAKKEEKKEKKKAKEFLQLTSRDDEDFGDESSDAEEEDYASETVDDEEEDEATADSEDEEASSDVAEDGTEQSDEEDASEDESASSDEEEASEDEEDSSSEDEGEASAADDEDQEESEGTDEGAMDEEEGSSDDTAGDDEEDSFVQTSNTIAVGDIAAGDAASDDDTEAAEPAENEAASDDNTEAAETAENEDAASSKTEEKDTERAADAPALGDETNDDPESFVETGSSWKPEPCGELEPGVPCTHLYEHPQGSTVVMPCPVERQGNPESCGALFGDKADGTQCPQITCSKAMGVTLKLVCAGGCCPTCWAPDHHIALDRHTTVDDAQVVDPAPQAAGTCGGVKCFKLTCAAGFTEGFVNGDCCYSCVQGR